MMTIESYEAAKDHLRENLSKYTRKAFQMLPQLDSPCILDIGCGRGVPTIELAYLSNGHITGLDTDETSLDECERKIKEKGLSKRARTVRCSMQDMDFPRETFDIIWAEGSIRTVGFKRGLREWRPFLKPNGFLVVHDDSVNLSTKLKTIPASGYRLLKHFELSGDTWQREYYSPLERLIQKVRREKIGNPKIIDLLAQDEKWVDMCRSNPAMCTSVFLLMQKVQG